MSVKEKFNPAKDRLRLVSSSDPQSWPHSTRTPIATAPFRPGELPVVSWIPLTPETRVLIKTAASTAAVPIELWVRIAVEASRLMSEIAELSGRPETEMSWLLSHAAKEDARTAPDNLAALALARYADELRQKHPCGELGPELAVRLPEEMNAAWSRTAARRRLSYGQWIAERLAVAPRDCVQWEIAAVQSCKSLGEWAYASSLRASTISSA